MSSSRKSKINKNQKKTQPVKPSIPSKPRKKTSKNRNKIYLAIGIIAVAAVVISAFVVFVPHGSATTTSEYSATSTQVLFITSMGNITIELRNDKPITTQNFVELVNEGYYNNTIFQRVLAGFMIQGGEGTTTQPTIKDEIGKDNVNSNMTIAMANTGQPNSASTQFFINVADNNKLYSSFDTSYTVFGQVIEGQNVVMAISQVPVEANSAYNGEVSEPITPVTLIGAVVLP